MRRSALVALRACVPVVAAQEGSKDGDEQKVIAEIRRLGGEVGFDEKRPGKPLVDVFLDGTKVTDAGLADLKGLKRLTHLYLCDTGVTDAGLAHLKGLTELQRLDLIGTTVTDTGVADLRKALPKVKIVR